MDHASQLTRSVDASVYLHMQPPAKIYSQIEANRLGSAPSEADYERLP